MRITQFVLLWLVCGSALAEVVTRDTILMGVSFSITAVHDDPEVSQQAINLGFKEVMRIEKLISSWDPSSQTSAINNSAGSKPVVVDQELYDLISRSRKISELSNGFFDISFASIHQVWDLENFKQTELPTDEEIESSVAKINYQRIRLDPESHSVLLQDAGMKIGFGAIGKGYAADRVKRLMVLYGIESGVVNAGGDLLSWGRKPDGSKWRVGITDPNDDSKISAWLDATDMAVVTSGNYKKFLMIDGKRYCHIINPKTGWPVEKMASVTIISADAEIADALATTVFVLGREEGLGLIDHLDGVECMIIDEARNMHFFKEHEEQPT